MVKTVLLTRLEAQNSQFESLFEGSDFCFVSKPLLTTEAIILSAETKKNILNLDTFDHIIFISRNAVNYGIPRLQDYWPQWPQSLSWFAVGPGTALLLENEDLEIYSPLQASSEGLLAMSELQMPRDKKILIVRGVGGREALREGLEERGASVEYAEVYQRNLVEYKSADWAPLEGKVFALIHSGEALLHLSSILGNLLKNYHLIVPSRRLQIMAIDEGFDKVELASSQQDSDMLESLLKCTANQEGT